MSDMELRVSKIKDDTVTDHTKGGYALDVVTILVDFEMPLLLCNS
jgi:aspartate carbamoyltransferase regulatory subunit